MRRTIAVVLGLGLFSLAGVACSDSDVLGIEEDGSTTTAGRAGGSGDDELGVGDGQISEGSGESEPDGSTDGTASPESTDDTEPASPDQQAVDAVLANLVAQLEGRGFTEVPAGDGDDEDEALPASCDGLDALFADDTELGETSSERQADREDANAGQFESVQLVAGLLASEDGLDETFEAFRSEDVGDCLADYIAADFADDDHAGDPELTDIEVEAVPSNGFGDDSAGVVLSAVMGNDVIQIPVVMSVELARSGRAAGLVSVVIAGTAEPSVDRAELLRTMVDQLAAIA